MNKINEKIKTICVFASSSNNISKEYCKAACELGCEIAKNNYDVVYGGSTLGLMGEVTKSAMENGSEVTGVMPEKLYNAGISSGNCTKFILTKGMRERKDKMDELSDAVIALAGGYGTLEELSEMLTQKQLGYNNKPIVIINTNKYYNNLIKFFDIIIKENFAPEITKNIYYIASSPKEAVEYINNYKPCNIDYLQEKLSIKS